MACTYAHAADRWTARPRIAYEGVGLRKEHEQGCNEVTVRVGDAAGTLGKGDPPGPPDGDEARLGWAGRIHDESREHQPTGKKPNPIRGMANGHDDSDDG